MVRSLALAAFLLLTHLWTATIWAQSRLVAASFLVTNKAPVGEDLEILSIATFKISLLDLRNSHLCLINYLFS